MLTGCLYYIIILDMFPAIPCLSSGGKIVLLLHLVSSLSVSSYSVHRLRADCSPLSTGALNVIRICEKSVRNYRNEFCIAKQHEKFMHTFDWRNLNKTLPRELFCGSILKVISNLNDMHRMFVPKGRRGLKLNSKRSTL